MVADKEHTIVSSSKAVCVVLDANIWIGNLFLRSALGSALLHMLQRVQGYIGLPEVIEEEVKKHVVRFGSEEKEKIRNSLQKIQLLTGKQVRCSLPTQSELEVTANSWFEELNALFLRIPFTIEHAKSALHRVNSELPPNAPKNQQFKDSAIWEAILHLAKSHIVHFVTKDNGFFQARDPAKGLASILVQECDSQGAMVRVYNELGSCLEYFQKTAPPLDLEAIARAVDRAIHNMIEKDATDKGFKRGDLKEYKVLVFPTQQVGISALKFEMTYQLVDLATSVEDLRGEASVFVKGDCSYNDKETSAFDVLFDTLEFQWQDRNGEIHKAKNIYVRVHDSIHITDSVG